MSTCTYCGGPITEGGHAGRGDSVYCCFGCLNLGEDACATGGCGALNKPHANGKFDGTAIRLGIGILVVGQSMIFGLALNLHDDVPPVVRELTQWLIFAGTMLVVALLSGPLVRTAWTELRRGRLTIEALFLLTVTGALAASLQAHLTGRGKIYFEVVSVLLVVYVLGKLIGARTRSAAIAGAKAWGDGLCTCRLVDAGGQTRTASVIEVQAGDVIEVHAGEMIAVDGVIREGVGYVSESVVTGEPFAVVRRPGDRVLAGSASFDATFRITATAKGTERQVDRILHAVENANDEPLSLQARADRVGRWFFPLVVVTSLGTFAYWTWVAGWETGLFNAMSVLLVACPCVIGLATPIVMWTALNRLAERGVIVRSGDVIERLASVDCVMFDKTGTLTEDRFTLVEIETAATGDERAKLLGWLSLVQSQSSHPVAKPFAELPRPFAPGAEPRVLSLVTVPGCGVVAELQEANGTRHEIKIGTTEWLSPALSRVDNSKTVHVVIDGTPAAVATVAERLRNSTPQALAEFAALGLPVEVLTGDASGRSESLGLPPARSGLLPDEKRAAVEEAKARGAKPLFVGDGINDASALATAHVGVALASGTDLAVNAAQVTLYSDDLHALPWAVQLSREAVRAVNHNLYRALCYNIVGMTLAACGVLHPVVAVLLMVVSSFALVFSSTRVGTTPASGGRQTRASTQSQEHATLTNRNLRLLGWFRLGGLTHPARRAILHGVAFMLQGFAFLLLLASLRSPPSAAILLSSFALAGIALGFAWNRWAIPHWLDMCVGMLTFGNLGMLLGWWADNGFAPLHDRGCCACIEAMRRGVMNPWMWVGMLVFANVAMRWFGRCPLPRGCHATAMFTGGNVGMVIGMFVGGWCAAQLQTESMTVAVAASFTGMTIGMLAGMLAGTWMAERGISLARLRLRVLLDEVEGGQPKANHDDRVADVAHR